MTDQDTITNVRGGAAVGGAAGGLLGALISFIMSTTPQAIPVIGPTVGQGVIATVLVGTLAGIGLGALVGALFGAFAGTQARPGVDTRARVSEVDTGLNTTEAEFTQAPSVETEFTQTPTAVEVEAEPVISDVFENAEPVISDVHVYEDVAPDYVLESAAPEAFEEPVVAALVEPEGPFEIEAAVDAAEIAPIEPEIADVSTNNDSVDLQLPAPRIRRARRIPPKYQLPDVEIE